MHFGIGSTADEVDVEMVLRALIKQAMSEGETIPDFVRQAVREHKRLDAVPSKSDLVNTLQRLFREARRDVYIVIESLDKCEACRGRAKHCGLLDFVLGLTMCDLDNLHILLASEKHDDITESVTRLGWETGIIHLDLASISDLQNFVSHRMEQLPSIRDMKEDKREELKRSILSRGEK